MPFLPPNQQRQSTEGLMVNRTEKEEEEQEERKKTRGSKRETETEN